MKPIQPGAIMVPILFALYGLFLFWLYLPVLDVYFSTDDWVFLYHVKEIPLSQPWRYFSPHAIWYYRPLHLLQFGINFHLFGLQPLPYNLQLILLYAVPPVLLFFLARKLFNTGIAALAALLFSANPTAPDVLYWKSNFNTLHYEIISLTCCLLFTHFLQTNNRRWYIAALLASFLAWFTKEANINIPLLLSACWITHQLQQRWSSAYKNRHSSNPRLTIHHLVTRYLRTFGPFFALAALYLILHTTHFRNVDPINPTGNTYVSPPRALWQWLFVTNLTLFNFISDPLLLPHLPALQILLLRVIQYGFLLPVIILIMSVWKKNATLIFAVLFILASHVPTFILTNYKEPRYLHLGLAGYGLFMAGLLWPLVSTVSYASTRSRVASILGFGVALWLIASSVVDRQDKLKTLSIKSAFTQQAADHLHVQAARIQPGSTVLIRNVPEPFLNYGIGATEMVRLITNRSDISALTDRSFQHPKFTPGFAQELRNHKLRYAIDILTTQPQLLPVRTMRELPRSNSDK